MEMEELSVAIVTPCARLSALSCQC